MQTEEVREIIRDGWNNQDRVDGWIESQLFREYDDQMVSEAWRIALDKASGYYGSSINPSALDIGTGPGTIARFWFELGFNTTGIDISPAMLESAKALASQNGHDIEYRFGDAQQPEFPLSSFDVISSRFLVFTLTHPGYAMRNWLKLLKPGGKIIMIGHDHPDKPQNRGHFKQPGKRRWQPSDKYRKALGELPFKNHTSAELRVVMEALGLTDITSVDTDEIMSARTELGKRKPELGEFSSVPFILCGVHEPDACN